LTNGGSDRNIEEYQAKQPAMNAQAIASHLNILDSAIIEIQEWASVLWVKFTGGVRFVSKTVGAAMSNTPKMDALKAEAIARFHDKAWDMILKASIGPIEERQMLSKVAPAARPEFQSFLERFIEIDGLDESGAEAEYMASIPEETQVEVEARHAIARSFLPC
jgi:hypothetical protein